MGDSLFSCHKLVLGFCAALAHASLLPIDCGTAGSHVSIHHSCMQKAMRAFALAIQHMNGYMSSISSNAGL